MNERECEEQGGHCYIVSDTVMASYPETYERKCKHCGKVQWGSPQPSMSWSDRP